MKVKCINKDIAYPNGDFTLNKIYDIVLEKTELDNMYCIIDDVKDRNYAKKSNFKIIKGE